MEHQEDVVAAFSDINLNTVFHPYSLSVERISAFEWQQ
jgi:hypothetical protein